MSRRSASLYGLARRKPEAVTAAVLLWAPVILTLALLTDDRDIIVTALLVASIPYIGLLVWMVLAAIQASEGIKRVFVVLAIAFFLLMAVSVEWGPALEY